MITITGNGSSNPSSYLDEAVCISHSANNTLGKSMNPTILPPAMGRIVRQTELFSFDIATSLGEGKL